MICQQQSHMIAGGRQRLAAVNESDLPKLERRLPRCSTRLSRLGMTALQTSHTLSKGHQAGHERMNPASAET
jgi:hypothetical protein